MSLRVRNLQVDIAPDDHDDGLAWWAEALGGVPRASEGPYTHLDDVRSPIGVHVQRLDAGPGRYHLDLEADDRDAEVARLLGLGAHRLGAAGDAEDAVVLTDPAGLPFCVTSLGQQQHLSDVAGPVAQLRVLMFDVPSSLAVSEAAFWAAAFGGSVTPVGEKFPEYTAVTGVSGPGGPVAVAVQDVVDAPARLHVDLHVDDPAARDREVQRLVAAGAHEVAAAQHWRVLAAPGGHLTCVVPDRPA